MDLSFGFAASDRRTIKSFSTFKNKSFEDNVLPFELPVEGDSNGAMFENSSGYSLTRLMIPNYGSGYVDKSYPYSKSNSSFHKAMVPKISSIAFSFSQQTIVGGFVGSKSHAGRSFFAESCQIWDTLIGRLVELMRLKKDKPCSIATESKTSTSKNSKASLENFTDLRNSNNNVLKEKVAVFPANLSCCYSNSETSDCNITIVGNLNSYVARVPDINPTSKVDSMQIDALKEKEVKNDCAVTLPKPQKETYSSIVNGTDKTIQCVTLPKPQKKTYSSIVNGTDKTIQCVQPISPAIIDTQPCDRLIETIKSSVPPPQKQTYAEVVKIIPHKTPKPQRNIGCEINQNSKRILNRKSDRINIECKRIPLKKPMMSVCKSKSPPMDEVIANGDTRWRADLKLKKAKSQKSYTFPVSCREFGGFCRETINKNVVEEKCAKECINESENERFKKEIIQPEFVNSSMRGRCPSECSVSSEDSFVIFEDYSDSSLGSSPHSLTEKDSEMDDDLEDDDSFTTDDDTDYEDPYFDNEDSLDFSPVASIKLLKANNRWGKEFPTCTVPDTGSKALKNKKVHFAEGCHLVVIRPMVAWGYAYRESRRGPWEMYARDRARFRCRIDSLAPLLNLVLDAKHRERILKSRFSSS